MAGVPYDRSGIHAVLREILKGGGDGSGGSLISHADRQAMSRVGVSQCNEYSTVEEIQNVSKYMFGVNEVIDRIVRDYNLSERDENALKDFDKSNFGKYVKEFDFRSSDQENYGHNHRAYYGVFVTSQRNTGMYVGFALYTTNFTISSGKPSIEEMQRYFRGKALEQLALEL